MSYSVYKHTFPNGKVYIGITKQKPKYRWGKDGVKYLRQTNKGAFCQPLIANAIIKYGWDNVQHEILFKELTKEEAEQKEIELIAFYRSNKRNYGYNFEEGGNLSCEFSQETKNMISNMLKGRIFSEEHKAKISKAHEGKILSKEHKEKISISHENKNNPFYGKHHTLESIEKIRKSNKKHFAIRCIETGIIYLSQLEAYRMTGISNKNISSVCRGITKTAGGYHWEFVTE